MTAPTTRKRKYNIASYPYETYMRIFQAAQQSPISIPFPRKRDAMSERGHLSKFREALRQADKREELTFCENLTFRIIPAQGDPDEPAELRVEQRQDNLTSRLDALGIPPLNTAELSNPLKHFSHSLVTGEDVSLPLSPSTSPTPPANSTGSPALEKALSDLFGGGKGDE